MNNNLLKKGYAPASDIADKLNRHVTTIYRWLDSGDVSGIRVGKLRYVQITSLFAYLGPTVVDTLELDRAYPTVPID